LSPNPSDETNTLLRLLVLRADNNTLTPFDLAPPFSANSNSVIVNCLLYASLSCSLLAAVGAMMAKEWLQSFDRTWQTGPPEEQARFRQRKFNGVLEWHLEAVIKFLPNLLLLSVVFFFVGVSYLLFPINTSVAGVVIAFSGIGVVFSGAAIVAGAVSPTCPYQSAASSALRRGCQSLVQFWKLVWRTLVRPAISRTVEGLRDSPAYIRPWVSSLVARVPLAATRVRLWRHRPTTSGDSGRQQRIGPDSAPTMQTVSESDNSLSERITPSHGSIGCFPRGVSQVIERAKRRWNMLPTVGFLPAPHQVPTVVAVKPSCDQVLTVQAARWLLKTTSNRGDQVSTAQLICSLDKATCAHIFEERDSWKRLFNSTLDAFEIWYAQPNKENQEVAELFGLALCRVILQCSPEHEKWKDIMENSSQGSNNFGKAFLNTLLPASTKYSPLDPEDDQRILHMSVIFTALAHRMNLKGFQWANSSRLLDSRGPAAAALLDVWAHLVCGVGVAQDGYSVMLLESNLTELWESQ
ncbi:hypothetical protein FRC01_001810, partial [Tulasnella sp. 417]